MLYIAQIVSHGERVGGNTPETKNPTKMKTNSIKKLLSDHLAGDGTANDSTTEDLYRAAHRLPADAETDLEAVEAWAFSLTR